MPLSKKDGTEKLTENRRLYCSQNRIIEEKGSSMKEKCFIIYVLFALFMARQLVGKSHRKALPKSSNVVAKWEFYKLCQFGYDPESDYKMFPLSSTPGGVSFDPSKVRKGDLIFLRARHTEAFFAQMVPNIQVPFIIVAHGEFKDGFMEEYLPYLEEPNLIAWFGTHPIEKSHDKFYALPLGIWPVSQKQNKSKELNDLLEELTTIKKDKLVYANFSEWTHGDRSLVKSLFSDNDYVTWSFRVPFRKYLSEMARHKFTFSPRGLGPDCYRTWEALSVGTIPIVKKSHLDGLYEGLPVLIVDSWEQVTEEFLADRYEEILSKKVNREKLTIGYWDKKINEVQTVWQNK